MRRYITSVLVVVALVGVLLSCMIPEPARTPNVDSVRALAKLYGYVRFFHPSDAAAETDWDRFAVYGIRQVSDARDAGELRRVLEELFKPIAPTVQIYKTEDGAPDPSPLLTPDDTVGLALIAWQHLGVGLGNPGPYKSIRLHRTTPEAVEPTAASFWQRLDARPYRGKVIRLSAAARVDERGEGSHAQLVLYDELPNLEFGFVDDLSDRPITGAEWQTFEVMGRVDEEADTIGVAGMLSGSGRAWFDDFQVYVQEERADGWQPVSLSNPGFEADTPRKIPSRWGVAGNGYRFAVDAAEAYEGSHSLVVEFAADKQMAGSLFPQRPEAGDVVNRSLGSGLSAQIPLAIYSTNGRTLRPEDIPSPRELAAVLETIHLDEMAATDEAIRYADILITWNVLQHFHPYFDVVDVDWGSVLDSALVRSAHDRDLDDHLNTLRMMMAQLEDGHGWVEHPSVVPPSHLPIQFDWIENQITVVATADSAVKVGDVVLSVDGEPARERLARSMALASGSEQHRRRRALRTMGEGEANTEAQLKLLRDEVEIDVAVPRYHFGVPREDRPNSLTNIAPGIFYVDLGRADMEAIAAHIDALSEADGVVFDLRGYPNGNVDILRHLTEQPIKSASWDLPQIIYPDHEDMVFDTTWRWTLQPRQPRISGSVVFLTDERAISQAESVMGIVDHYDLAGIVGRPTAGANGDINRITLPGGATVTFTGMRVEKHNGSQLHTVGILPTIPVQRTLTAVRAGRDEDLERAIRLVQSE